MSSYVVSPALDRAVKIALQLNKPLLLTGDPGTGKTTLAKYLAKKYSDNPIPGHAPFLKTPYIFDTKTISTATDLFYSYDALGRLRDAYGQIKKETGDYIELKALGRAMANKHGLNSPGLDRIRSIRDFKTEPNKAPSISEEPRSSVVLIDEIDKATRDFPNDILNEIELMEFYIRELDAKVEPAKNDAHILVIMTSNNEKNLPDAFLRRCIFHYIEFPGPGLLQDIVCSHFPDVKIDKDAASVMGAVKTFNQLRQLSLLKKPATAEFIDWLRMLEKDGLLADAVKPYETIPDNIKDQLKTSLCILIKNFNDLKQAEDAVGKM